MIYNNIRYFLLTVYNTIFEKYKSFDMSLRKITLLTFTLLIISWSVKAQGTQEDYLRADSLKSLFSGKVYYGNVKPSWIGETNMFVYPNVTPDGTVYIIVSPDSKEKKIAFSNERLARAMSKISGKDIDSKDLPISSVSFDDDLKSFSFVWDNINWKCKLSSYKITSGERIEGRRQRDGWVWATDDEISDEPVESPDGKWTAYIRNYNIYIKDSEENEYRLSYDGGLGEYYSSNIRWSPDSKKLCPASLSLLHKSILLII